MFSIRFNSEAFEETMAEAQSEGLGKRFVNAVNVSTRHIQLKPALYAGIPPGRKRCLVNNFPLSVIYRIKNRVIEIIAVAHARRESGYGQNRNQRNTKAKK